MYYLIYKISNRLNDKIYIGAHKTKDLDDGYMGSSRSLTEDIKKFGIKNFKKEILRYAKNSKEMYSIEAKLVTESFVKRKDTYNLQFIYDMKNLTEAQARAREKHLQAYYRDTLKRK